MKLLCIGTISLSLLLPGCWTTVRPTPRPSVTATPKRVLLRNYALNEPREAYVGQPIVSYKDYYLKGGEEKVTANINFEVQQALSSTFRLQAGTTYPVVATLEIEGVPYRLVGLPRNDYDSASLPIDADGRPYHRLVLDNILTSGQATFRPEQPIFSNADIVDTTRGYKNYELLYGGTDGKSFTLTYREYTIQDSARPAFTQVISYERSSPTIRFRQTKITVHTATNERIKYTVHADDDRPEQ